MKQKWNLNLILGSIIAGTVLLFIFMGIFYTPYDPDAMDGLHKFSSPSITHLMGTDNFGRDIFSRVLKGAGTTLTVAASAVAIGAFFGTLIGACTGYYGGIVDEILMRMNDALTAFPSILLALVLVSISGSGKYHIIVALGVVFIPSFARMVRSEFIHYKNRDYVKSARLLGAGNFRIMFFHILPNTLPILLSSITIGFNNAVLAEAGLSYLGIGVQPPDSSLGRMLSESQTYLFTAPWYCIFPGITIVLLVLGLSLISEGFQERAESQG